MEETDEREEVEDNEDREDDGEIVRVGVLEVDEEDEPFRDDCTEAGDL